MAINCIDSVGSIWYMIMSSFFIDSARVFFSSVSTDTTHNEYRWIPLKLISFKLPPERSISFVQKRTHLGSRTTASAKRCPKVNQWVIRNDDELLIRYDDSIYIWNRTRPQFPGMSSNLIEPKTFNPFSQCEICYFNGDKWMYFWVSRINK